MKIFGTKKKKLASSSTTTTFTSEHKSDPLVQELLLKDPTTWNAKERRMVKRYQQRNSNRDDQEFRSEVITNATTESHRSEQIISELPEASPTQNDESFCTVDLKQQSEADKDGDHVNHVLEPKDDSYDTSIVNDERSTSISSRTNSNNKGYDENHQDNSAMDTNEIPLEKSNEVNSSNIRKDNDTTPFPAAVIDAKHKIWKILDQLNSKHKRTLTRKLQRLGSTALKDVETEAQNLLQDDQPKSTTLITPNTRTKAIAAAEMSSPSTSTGFNESSTTTTSKKRKRNAQDLSALPPEERLRRQEQRRLQQEAAERRAKGEHITPGHKKPLNSERRRANRRKPKWRKNDSGIVTKNDRNSSGYHLRKHSVIEGVPEKVQEQT